MRYTRKFLLVFVIGLLTFAILPFQPEISQAFTPQVLVRGSQGYDVDELQGRLRYVNYYHGPMDGKFSWETYWAVRNFQRDVHIKVDGIVGPQTKMLLVSRSRNYHAGMYKTVTNAPGAANRQGFVAKRLHNSSPKKPVTADMGTYNGKFSAHDISLLAHCVYSEARGEPFIGQVAVAATVLNRLHSPLFPHTIAGILFQPGAFTSVSDGQFYLTPNASAHKAVMDAIQGLDPTGGALYYFNPATATSKWIWSRPQIKKIGQHIFTR
ncbi:spore cortex-lytic enzyme [Fodinisporobacter ferrooxydans]|uniref:Spore cortex-lytic enzyme n=1 Tax=Fodinisporobacter ferrooxydans TaxID=2901836 RepID=A0ABY4CJ70_9BACL|nr:spore cortex-lytic enzyme [Alicyclobacillaceae bacterium MYW30-H2]